MYLLAKPSGQDPTTPPPAFLVGESVWPNVWHASAFYKNRIIGAKGFDFGNLLMIFAIPFGNIIADWSAF